MIKALVLLALVGNAWGAAQITADGLPIDVSGPGSIWTTNDAANDKIYAGINCYKTTDSATEAIMDFRVYNRHIGEDTTEAPGEWYFNYEKCEALDYDMTQAADPMKVEAVHDGSCDATKTGTNGEFYQFQQTVQTDGSAAACGSVFDTNVWSFAVRCQRWAGYDSQYDRVFLYSCDMTDTTQTLITTLTGPMLQVGKIPAQNVVRRYMTTMDIINSNAAPNPTTDVPVTAAVNLGDPLWVRICFKIRSPEDPRTMFDMDGQGPFAAYPYSCYASAHADQVADGLDTDIITDPVEILNSDSCGLNTPVAQQIYQKKPKWIKHPDDGPEAWMFSPNCVYFGSYEAVSLMGKDIQAPADAATRKMKIECSLKYCLKDPPGAGDPNCLGGKTGVMTDTGYGEDSCPEKRKKRADVEVDYLYNNTDLVKKVSTTFEIRLNSGDKDKSVFPKCIANSTFYSLTGVLAFLLLVVLAIGVYLTLKLRRLMNDRDSENSMTGIPNKAYY